MIGLPKKSAPYAKKEKTAICQTCGEKFTHKSSIRWHCDKCTKPAGFKIDKKSYT